MTSIDAVRAEVEAARVTDGRDRQRKRLGRLLGGGGFAARAVFNLEGRRAVPDADLARTLDDLRGGRRRRFFKAIHPPTAEDLDRLWTATATAPIKVGPDARAFRAPSNPAATARGRLERLRMTGWWLGGWDRHLDWLAEHGGHVRAGPQLGWMLAAAIDAGGRDADRHADLVMRQATGGGLPGSMGHHVPVAMLGSARPELWAQASRLLVAAKRQGGLRQAILEAADLGHPGAFRAVLTTILEEGLTRFAATARACSVWLGEPFEARDRRLLDDVLARLVDLVDRADEARQATESDDPADVRLGLWATALTDADPSVARARARLASSEPEIRLVAVRHLADLGPLVDRDGVRTALADQDDRVRAVAFAATRHWRWRGHLGDGSFFDDLRGLHDRTTDDVDVPVGTWKPVRVAFRRPDVADAVVDALGDRSPRQVEDLVPAMGTGGRAAWATRLAQDARAHRTQLLDLVGDRAQHPRQIALDALRRLVPSREEAIELEALLTRKSGDLRRGVLALLLNQVDPDVVATIGRLRDGKARQQAAADELVQEMRRAGRGGRALTEALPAPPPPPGAPPPQPGATRDRTTTPLEAGVASTPSAPVSSLIDHTARTPAIRPDPPSTQGASWSTGAGLVLTSLEAWLAEHADVEVEVGAVGGERRVELLANLRWIRRLLAARPWEEQADAFPLPDIVEPWWERTAPQLSAGRAEVLVATAVLDVHLDTRPLYPVGPKATPPQWAVAIAEGLPGADAISGERLAISRGLLAWLGAREATTAGIEALLDVAEHVLAAVPAKVVRRTPTAVDVARARFQDRPADWRDASVVAGPLRLAVQLEALRPELWRPEHRTRLVRALRFLDEPTGTQPHPKVVRVRPMFKGLPDRDVPDRPVRRPLPLRLLCRAVDDGAAQRDDVVELLAGERCPPDHNAHQPWDDVRLRPLAESTRRARASDLAGFDWFDPLVEEVRNAILDVELARGELPTPVTPAAVNLRTVVGAQRVVAALANLGAQTFVRGYTWAGRDGKQDVLSRLVRVSFPGPDDDAEQLRELAEAAGVKPARLVDLAVYAPQWADLVEVAVDQPGLADAIRWLHAHTKDDRWQVDPDVRSEWLARVHEQTPLTGEDLVAGAVDVDWFRRAHDRLGPKRFTTLLKAAKYASSSGGHKRAELFAKALLGKVTTDELEERGAAKRHQDTVRAIGLVPLPNDGEQRRAEVLRRWQWLQEWSGGSRQFGQQRRASEGLAVRIATENLARTAGYADPQRLTWAMEAEAVRDLADGPVVAQAQDVTVTLAIDQDGAPALAVERAGRNLKNIPRTVGKDPAIAELKDRAKQVRAQARRMRRSLEDAMVRGDVFRPAEFEDLRGHAVLRPMLERLLVVDAGGAIARPSRDGFVGPDEAPTRPRGALRVAHPHDLLAAGTWHDWQHALFSGRVRQPCKQVFRELYVPTAAEEQDGFRIRRYAGQQVQAGQASALLGSRGWVVSHEGEAIRAFHDEDLTAHLTANLATWGTPAEVEDTAVEDVVFTRRGSWDPLPLADVPPRLFSEVLRDVDLAVSVAHASGIDPEASASTIEVRAAILQETADLLSLDGVEVTDHHAMIRGTLGNYSVHLGSGTVHKRPGQAVCIIPVSSQQRGRVFLPFVDDDPRTAEVVAKVLLLARDDKIQDPTILDQIR